MDQELPPQVQNAVACLIGFLKHTGAPSLRVPVHCMHGKVQYCVVVARDELARNINSFAEFEEECAGEAPEQQGDDSDED